MNLADFDMNLLKVLAALMEERSVTRAGNRLGRTQSAVSNALGRLRTTFDDPLLVRSPEGMVLTPKAAAIQAQLRDIMRLTEACLSDTSSFDAKTADGLFRVGAPDRLSLPVGVPFLKALRREAPGISVDLVTADREPALGLLDADRLDIAIGWFDKPPPRFNASFLFREALVCLCRDDHPLRDGTAPADLPAVLSYPHLIVSSAGDRRAGFDDILSQHGLKRHAAISVSNFSMVPGLLQDSDLIGVFTRGVSEILTRQFGLATVPLPLEVSALEHYVIWHRRNDADERHGWLREQIRLAATSTDGDATRNAQ